MNVSRLPNQDWNDYVKVLLTEELDASPLDADETMRIICRLTLDRADMNFTSGKTDRTWLRRTRITVRDIDHLTGRPAVRWEERNYSHDERMGMVGMTLGSMLAKRTRRTRSWVLRALEETLVSGRAKREINEAARRRGAA